MLTFFRPTNRRARLIVGLMLAGLFCIQCTRSNAFRQEKYLIPIANASDGIGSDQFHQKINHLAKTDQIALLEWCQANCASRYRDYTCTFLKQERINGVLGQAQEIRVKFLNSPYSVAMAWTPQTAPIGDRVVYVEGRYNNCMLVRPKGVLYNLIGTQLRDPNSAEAMQNTLRPVNMFGFHRSIESLLEVYRQAAQAGDLKTEFGGYVILGDRKAARLIRYLPPKNNYPAYRTVIYIDVDYLLPIMVEGYDWDDQPICQYLYKDLQFNLGLGEKDFLPESNDMKPPKS